MSDPSQTIEDAAEAPPAGPRAAAQAARRAAILSAAKQVFFDEGYQLASMDRIAERAGTTKRTVYDHFGSKDGLFAAVVEHGCANVLAELPAPEALPEDPREGVAQFIRRGAELMASVNCVKLERLVVAEAERHPDFAHTLAGAYRAGEERLAAYLARAITAGRLKPHDPALAARLLSDAVMRGVSMRGLLGGKPDAAEAARAAESAIALYLAAYAV